MHLSLPSIPFLSQPSQGTPRPSLPSSGAFKKWTLHFENVFYPRLCVSCTDRKALPGHCFCPVCRVRVIVQDMYKQSDNEFTERFWGRVPLQTGAALFKFAKKCPIQRALHRLKYGNHPQTGRLLGREMGLKLSKSPHYQQVDVVVCVPLHPLKEKNAATIKVPYSEKVWRRQWAFLLLKMPCIVTPIRCLKPNKSASTATPM